jgi:hypothetical protein
MQQQNFTNSKSAPSEADFKMQQQNFTNSKSAPSETDF